MCIGGLKGGKIMLKPLPMALFGFEFTTGEIVAIIAFGLAYFIMVYTLVKVERKVKENEENER